MNDNIEQINYIQTVSCLDLSIDELFATHQDVFLIIAKWWREAKRYLAAIV